MNGPLATVRRTLRSDAVVHISLLVYAVVIVPFVLPVLTVDQLRTFSEYYSETLLSVMALAAVLYGLRKIDRPGEKAFWRLIAFGYGSWLAVWLYYFVVPVSTWSVGHDLVGSTQT